MTTRAPVRRRSTRARPAPAARRPRSAPAADAQWYKDAVLYEVSVRAFADSDGDGIGDLPGLIAKLDYVQALGADTLWLQPFYPSPLRDDGYDVSDLRAVHPAHGTLDDFARLVEQAHARGLRVVTEIVLNHTSDQHPWFQRARRAAPGSPERERYVWSDRPDRYPEARIVFAGVESSNWAWDPVAAAYYWHRFHAHEPDLNFDREEVRRDVVQALDFWLGFGVDGLRLGAVPFLFEREGTACEDLPESHAFLGELRRHVDRRHPGKVLITEANLWPEDAGRYAAHGGGAHLAFLAPLAPRLFTALHMEDRHPVVDVLAQTPPPAADAQYALFLRNHDEVALEMVTDEERDTLYRAYAADPQARIHEGIRRRLAPLLGNDRRRIELMTGLLFSLPGTPALYYGDEIGMGDNIYLSGRKGVRTPMQWSAAANGGFSDANPQRLYLPPVTDPEFSYVSVNVAAQEANPRSLLAWTRRLIALRRRHPVFGRGSIEFLHPANRKVLAFVREHEGQRVLVIANLGRHVQHVELDLSSYAGCVPVELSGRGPFPAVTRAPYPITLAGHAFFWFELAATAASEEGTGALPRVAVAGPWPAALEGGTARALQDALPGVLGSRRWFAGKARTVRDVTLVDSIAIPTAAGQARWAMAAVEYAEGEPETYALPLAHAAGEDAGRIREPLAGALVAEVESDDGRGLLYGAERSPAFARALLDAIATGARFRGASGEIVAARSPAFDGAARRLRAADEPKLLSAEQSNSSIRFGRAFILKIFRKTEPGPSPDLEVGAFLTDRASFPHTPPVCGRIEYVPRRGEPMALAILQGYVENEGDAWSYTLDAVADFFERRVPGRAEPPAVRGALVDQAKADPTAARERVGPYLDAAALLGRRTAELHRALASDREDPAFAPEPFSRLDQRASYQSLRNLAAESFDLLRRRLPAVPEEARALGRAVLERRDDVAARFRRILDRKLTAERTRIHGDYHLGQVLWTGRDFVIIDFEGEPARPAAIRRAKRSPLKDVAGMLRSYHYAAFQGLATHAATGAIPPDRMPGAEAWATAWHAWVSAAFLRGYLATARGASFLPRDEGELEDLLVVHVLEKAVYELAYELNNRPGWVRLPLAGIARLIGGTPS